MISVTYLDNNKLLVTIQYVVFGFVVSPKTFAPKLVIVDFSDMLSMEDVVAEVVDCYGCVDVLICNSSMKLKAPVQSVSLEVDRNIMDINYFGPSTLAKGGLDVTSENTLSRA